LTLTGPGHLIPVKIYSSIFVHGNTAVPGDNIILQKVDTDQADSAFHLFGVDK